MKWTRISQNVKLSSPCIIFKTRWVFCDFWELMLCLSFASPSVGMLSPSEVSRWAPPFILIGSLRTQSCLLGQKARQDHGPRGPRSCPSPFTVLLIPLVQLRWISPAAAPSTTSTPRTTASWASRRVTSSPWPTRSTTTGSRGCCTETPDSSPSTTWIRWCRCPTRTPPATLHPLQYSEKSINPKSHPNGHLGSNRAKSRRDWAAELNILL